MRTDCEFEAEVLAAAMESRWPHGAGNELRDHASRCVICSEAALVAAALGDERNSLRVSAAVPDSGRVWWLAQIRARREALAAVERPITIVHMLVFACAAGLLGACFGATSAWFQEALRRIATPLAEHYLFVLGAAVVLLAIGGAAFFAIQREGRNVTAVPPAQGRQG